MNAQITLVVIIITLSACVEMPESQPEFTSEQQDLRPEPGIINNCHILLEPLDVTDPKKDKSSKVLNIFCTSKEPETSELTLRFGTLATYKVAQFFDGTQYTGSSISYYGAYQCSSSISYGVTNLYGTAWNERFDSALVDTGGLCGYGQVFDRPYYATPMYDFNAGSPDFLSLKNVTTSWRVCNYSGASGCRL